MTDQPTNRVRPGPAAQDAATRWLERTKQAADRWNDQVSKISLHDWQQACLAKGGQVIEPRRRSWLRRRVDRFLDRHVWSRCPYPHDDY